MNDYKELIRTEAARLGFDACGFARAEAVDAEAQQRYDRWIAARRHDCMDYATRYLDVRSDPRRLLDGAQTVISLAIGYYPAVLQDRESPQFSFYAYGRDYHEVLRERLRALATYVKELTGCESRACVDTAPIREKYWAQRAGIGFVGRNNLLILPGRGSFFFLGELVTTLAVEPDEPCRLTCGDCRRCEIYCPGKALSGGEALDASRCLSCQLIENRSETLPEWVGERAGLRVYGCDACQRCCPHNAYAEPTRVPDFAISPELQHITADDIASMTEEQFRALFRHSAVWRLKLARLKRNLEEILGNRG